jgi:hypothetical protein
MSIQPVYNAPMSPELKTASTSSDPEVQKIMSQIKDWEGCPTTDPHTKKEKVAALEQKLSLVESSLKNHAKNAQAMRRTPSPQSGDQASSSNLSKSKFSPYQNLDVLV